MNINWKVRFRNKVWLTSIIAVVVDFVFSILGLFDVAPSVSEDALLQGAIALLNILAAMGVLIDPTTKGLSDSERALGYEEPK